MTCAKQLASRLDEHNRRVHEQSSRVDEAKTMLEKTMLTEEEKENIKSLNLNSSHTDLLASLKRLMEVRAVNPDQSELFSNTTEIVTEWFDRNISTVRLDMVSPSLNTIVSYMVSMNGAAAFLDRFSERRSQVTFRDFLEALTTGVRAKPIEMHAYSPVRYISDMLAWIHEAFANELDLLDSLTEEIEIREKKAACGKSLAKVADELKGRAEPALQRISSISTAYSVAMLFGYYLEWFQRQLQDGRLLTVLKEMYEACWVHLEELLANIDSELAEPIDSRTLLPTSQMSAILNEIDGLEHVHKTGLLPSGCRHFISEDEGKARQSPTSSPLHIKRTGAVHPDFEHSWTNDQPR